MKLVKGKKAATPEGMEHNVKTMEKAGYSKKRAQGTAYGEVGMEKKARKKESKTMKKHDDAKLDKVLIKKTIKKSCVKE